MSEIRTIRLELVRHGPPHNQLLSPLTEYLALCGNHAPETVTVPFEHQQFLTRLRALDYRESRELREMMLADTCQELVRLLAQLRCLTAELADSTAHSTAPLHLELVLSASELALLPFELAIAADGSSGAGGSIALPDPTWLCLTRQVRRVSRRSFNWPAEPKILFASALPAADHALVEAHVLALRQVVNPWLSEGSALEKRNFRGCVHLLPNASLAKLEEQCRRESYTHVHILAHGQAVEEAADRRFGIAFLDPYDPGRAEVVSGSRLAAALRQPRLDGEAGPAVVTLASCQSSQQGSVLTPGGSVAHALHAAGIPLVVASQFPLTFAGSVVMAQVLYERMLWGEDPRVALAELRRRLQVEMPESHDWASIVAYAALPDDLGEQLARIRVSRANQSIDAVLCQADAELKKMNGEAGAKPRDAAQEKPQGATKRTQEAVLPPTPASVEKETIKPLIATLKARIQHLCQLAGKDTYAQLLLGSAEKRRAQLEWRSVTDPSRTANAQSLSRGKQKERPSHDLTPAIEALERSRRHYQRAFELTRSSSWAMVQLVVLNRVLNKRGAQDQDLLQMARTLDEIRVREGTDPLDKIWALTELIEIALLMPPEETDVASRAKALTGQLIELVERTQPDRFALLCTLRQLLRYRDFFPAIAEAPDEKGLPNFETLVDPVCQQLRDACSPDTELH